MGPVGLGPVRLSLSRLGSGFRGGLSPPLSGGFVFVRLLHRDLLLDGLFLARRFLVSPFLAGRLAIGGPRRAGPVQRGLSRHAAAGRFAQPGERLWRFRPLWATRGRWLDRVSRRLLVSVGTPYLTFLGRDVGS